MTRRMVERFRPEVPPDWQRGALRRAASRPPRDRRFSVRTPEAVELWYQPGAADLGDDWPLSSTVMMLEELKASGAAADLIGRCAEARARRHGPGGRRRMQGSFELLYLAFVDQGYTSRQHFWGKLEPELLSACGFERRPSWRLLEYRFSELERDWREFRSVKNVLVRACVAAEPRVADCVSIDATLLRSAFCLRPRARSRRRGRQT